MEQPATQTDTVKPLPQEESQSPEAEDPGLIGVLDLLMPLIRRRRLLVMCTVAGLLLGLLWTLRKGIYVAATTVLPPQSSVTSGLLGQIGSLAGLVGGAGLSVPHGSQDLYVSLMQSPSVQDAVVQRFHLDKVYGAGSPGAARVELSKHCIIDGSGRDGMIRISVHDADDPKRAADVANGYVNEFMKFMSHLAVSEAAQRRLFFEEQMQKEKSDLTDAEDNLRKTEQKTGAVQLDAQTRVLVDSAANLRAQVAAKQVQIQSIRAYAGPDNINLQRAEQELAVLRSQLATVADTGTGAQDAMAVSRNALPQTALDNIRAQREVKYHESIFGILSNQYEAARLDEAREGAAVQVVEPATAPEGRSAKPATTKVMVGTLLGFFMGFIYIMGAYAWERMRANRLFAGKLSELHDAYVRNA
ncbi:GumC family protein [Terriglobus sp.]|uniref:GumC family protein n=1 Tax=Terriglobus sp. TaxID=1889013 RepID=UPI003AFFE938